MAISLDGLCYRSWEEMARTTAHATARYLGLYRNREPDGALDLMHNVANGLIVHDQPGDLDYPADGTNDGVSNLTLPATASTSLVRA